MSGLLSVYILPSESFTSLDLFYCACVGLVLFFIEQS